jgi:peptide/nickel transport system permease protein
MTRLLARRAAQGVVIVWLVATFTFVLIALAPGDVVDATLSSDRVPESVRAHARQEFCLDRGLAVRYGCWVRSLAKGDFGWSLPQQRPVSELLAEAIPNTLLLMGIAIAGSFLLGISAGIAQAWRPRSALDRGIGAISMFFYAMPDFWLALIVMFLFAYEVRWFPASGVTDPSLYSSLGLWGRLGDRARHLVLPAGTLILLTSAAVSRFQRSAMLDVLTQDFVRTARAKGLSERQVLTRHVLRNALLPMITLLGLSLPALLGGAVLVERVFSWPGMGMLATGAVSARDYPLLIATTVVASVMVVVGSLAADLLYALADPRVRSG